MANSILLTLFLILTTLFTTTTAINSTRPTINTTATAINSTIPTTTTTVNSTKPTKNTTTTATNSAISTTYTTTNTMNSTKPIKDTTTTTDNSTKHPKNATTTTINSTTSTTTTTHPTNNMIITPQQLDTLLQTLQYAGYPLFSNAISTSDVHFQLLTPSQPFTLFAPKDHFLYTLDMATDADAYVAALKCHVIPSHRLTFSNLRNLTTTFPYLETLLPHYSVLVGKGKTDDSFVTVDGVRVSDPDLYVGSGFAVHGLDGILLTGFNMYEDSLGEMGRGFFAPANYSGRNSATSTPRKAAATVDPAVKMAGFSRIVRKQRKLQYRKVSRKDDF